ncbi:MAG: peptide chain release factor 2 [Deltaproteobacteria bacterium]|nr:peptide chain release factor 2 [Deltaproteobacteria bacterium]MBW1918982.1 peptide chain release factor 2 [Deltaproteobacteria bacterium]MBW1935011.1 peptide chain release factor 2 [Deltaproteobacteria bacterium]MBW1977055.1 peptide chain release factor 2 [Deltaproteobacteria bacterium]MBW2044280.1 peptide chain release factor 2 [Deltaproteobacteria bacterium]
MKKLSKEPTICWTNFRLCGVIFDLDEKENELKKIEKIMARADFWQKNQQEISRLSQQRVNLKENIEEWAKYYREAEDAKILAQMALEEDDEHSLSEAEKDISRIEKQVERLQFQLLLSDPDDKRNAIVAINAGAGGTEAQDWAEILFRMYLRWCESRGFSVELIDNLPGDEAGIKNVTFAVKGPYAYGYLKSENGIHRMVRISPFDATKRRHTSFASVSVFPEADTDIKIEIDEKDLRIDTFRASGPGGQHVNKTSSAVRITHLPTGIVVQCQNEKSQHRNREMALRVLKTRLYDLERRKLDEKKQKLHEGQKEIAWGSQIRSYVFNPYRMVKDHRTNLEVGDLERVMDGDIDMFIDAYLKMKRQN